MRSSDVKSAERAQSETRNNQSNDYNKAKHSRAVLDKVLSEKLA